MLIGNTHIFGIECHHEPIPNETKRVFGRMCIFASNQVLGSIDEPACMLNVTEGHLSDVIRQLPSLKDETLENLTDLEAFNFLDHALYMDDDRSDLEVQQDAERYSKFDFLTNGGESFDGTKSFIVASGSNVRLLFTDAADIFYSALVPHDEFVKVVTAFFVWIDDEGRNVRG